VIETDYRVVGAGASGLAFADALINRADVDVVMIDRRASRRITSGGSSRESRSC
jgi:ribulose 1,5-bisphosphate synthetase/thiazole synthase